MKRLIYVFPLIILILAACGKQDEGVLSIENEIEAIEAAAGEITEIECPLQIPGETEGETYACGVYTVPVDYGQPDGETINLAYTILYASGEDPLPDPIVSLAGGPGQSGIVSAGSILHGDLRQDRDLIFPAQRGKLFAQRLGLEDCIEFLSDQIGDDEIKAFVEQVSANQKPDRSLPYDDYLAQYSKTAGEIDGRCSAARLLTRAASSKPIAADGRFLSEPQLLAVGHAVGHAVEQATQARVAPDLEATMELIDMLP